MNKKNEMKQNTFIEYSDVILFFLGYAIAFFSSLAMGSYIIFYDTLPPLTVAALLFGSLLSAIGLIIFIFYKRD